MRLLPVLLLLAPLVLAGCTQDAPAPASTNPPPGASGCAPGGERAATHANGTVTLLTYTAYGVPKEAFSSFTNETGYQVEIVTAGDAGATLAKALVTKDAPVADVLFGVDNAYIYRAKAEGVFQPYASLALAGVPDKLRSPFCLDGAQLATPIDYGFVQLNYDTAWFAQHAVALPKDLKDIAMPAYAKLTVVEDPSTSSPGMAFLLATIDRFGENGAYTYKDFWSDYAKNGGKITTDWDSAYGKVFTQGYDATGTHDRPIVLSYSTSPAFNPMFGYGNATSANLDLAKGAWFQIETAGLLKNAKNADGGRALIDHMLTKAFQETSAFDQVEYPVLSAAKAPEAYAEYAPEPKAPASLAAKSIEQSRDAWIKAWRDATGQ